MNELTLSHNVGKAYILAVMTAGSMNTFSGHFLNILDGYLTKFRIEKLVEIQNLFLNPALEISEASFNYRSAPPPPRNPAPKSAVHKSLVLAMF